jgi:hypothetical protein
MCIGRRFKKGISSWRFGRISRGSDGSGNKKELLFFVCVFCVHEGFVIFNFICNLRKLCELAGKKIQNQPKTYEENRKRKDRSGRIITKVKWMGHDFNNVKDDKDAPENKEEFKEEPRLHIGMRRKNMFLNH